MTAVDVELRAIVRQAASLLPALVAVVECCRTDPDPGQELARQCGELNSAFARLIDQLFLLPRSALVDRVETMLRMEQRIVHEASRLAFRPHTERWLRVAASFGDGLTDSSDELLHLAAQM
jgi:hypothetical protein